MIMRDPRTAIVELVANSWDAGATRVEIDWPSFERPVFRIADNGQGMTPEEFQRRWRTLNYQRIKEQGAFTTLGDGTKRVVFGRNGKGRHGAFSFGEEYHIVTFREGVCTKCRVQRSTDAETPFRFEDLSTSFCEGDGTIIEVTDARVPRLAPAEVRELIGTRFFGRPSVYCHR